MDRDQNNVHRHCIALGCFMNNKNGTKILPNFIKLHYKFMPKYLMKNLFNVGRYWSLWEMYLRKGSVMIVQ